MYPFIYLLCMISSLFIYYLLYSLIYLLCIFYIWCFPSSFNIYLYILSSIYSTSPIYPISDIIYPLIYFVSLKSSSFIQYLLFPLYHMYHIPSYLSSISCEFIIHTYLLYLFLQLSSLYTKQPVYIYPSSTPSYISTWSLFLPSSSVKSAY